MVREAEHSRARIYDVQGKTMMDKHSYDSARHYLPIPDEDYLMVGNHIENSIKRKIIDGEYVDFARLMPKDRIMLEEDNRMEMVNKGGLSYWIPVAEKEVTTINSFYRWEQAFRVFSNIYMEAYPGKAGELIQYNHVIHTASQTFSWDNVYRYDREFRIHMSKHHLAQSCGVILQQAWSMYLKDKINAGEGGFGSSKNQSGGSNGSTPNARHKLCFNYNAGNCSYGHRCRFDHRCSFCNKFGHGDSTVVKRVKEIAIIIITIHQLMEMTQWVKIQTKGMEDRVVKPTEGRR